MPLDGTNWRTETTDDKATALLIRARGLLERGWCRGTLARNFLGFTVPAYSTSATRWCASGALTVAAMTDSDLVRRHARNRLVAVIGGGLLGHFNDSQETVEPILAAFDKAIAGEPSARLMPKAPSWPIIIVSGAAGGAVNWYLEADLLGFLVFVALTVLLVFLQRSDGRLV
jgi:hypothetical protein